MSVTHEFSAVLFDMDNTLLDSHYGLRGAWEEIAQKYPESKLDVDKVMVESQGVRTIDNFRKYFGITDPVRLQEEAVDFEVSLVKHAYDPPNGPGLVCIPGGPEAVQAISSNGGTWAVCTSANSKYAKEALKTTGYTIPEAFVTAELVSHGKPAPDPYLLGASKLGVPPTECLVVEDAPNGILSGKAAGAKVLGLLTSHTREAIEAVKPDWIVKDLTAVKFEVVNSKIQMTIL